MVDPILKAIDVPCDADKAFAILTERIDSWWPKDKHSISAMSGGAARRVTLEPKVGGHVVEVDGDGTEHHWATVTVFEPARRLVLSWHIMVPKSEASEVEFTFEPIDGGTRVALEHRGWTDTPQAAERRDSYANGWIYVFEAKFAAACGR